MFPLWLLGVLGVLPISEEMVRSSVEKGVKRLETASASYIKNRTCFSCHHQAMPVMALASAKERGFTVDAMNFEKQVKYTLDFFSAKVKDISEGRGIGGANTTAAYALLTFELAQHPADATTDALVDFLVKKQASNGSWAATTNRPPSEGSLFTTGALSVGVLKAYKAKDEGERADKIAKARENGLAFLEKAEVKTTEDRVFKIWGLLAGGADKEMIAEARDDLQKQQRPDGGWAQLDELKSDAYATGAALVVLQKAGLAVDSAAYRAGVRFLVLNQDVSGGWIVPTRSRPIQTFFDNGDPGGKGQFISTAATGWAVTALVATISKK